MKKVGVGLLTLGVVCLVLVAFPQLVVAKPKDGFGPLQTIVLAVGLILLIGGGAMFACKRGKCAAKEPEAPQAPTMPPAAEPPKA